MMQAKPVGKERQKTIRIFVGVAIHRVHAIDRVVQVLKLAETQKFREEVLVSLETAVTKCLCS